MNRLNFRLLAAFSVVLILTLVIMWIVLLFVLRARPVNTDSQAIDLAATLIETEDALVQEFAEPRTQGSGRRLTAEEIERILLDEADTHDVNILLLHEPACVIWDTQSLYPRNLQGSFTREPFLGSTNRPNRPAGDVFFSGQFTDAEGAKWLFVGQPLRPVQDVALSAWGQPLANQSSAVCGTNQSRQFSLVVAEPYPEQTFRSVLQDYSGSGLLLALVQAVFIGLFFALIASFLIFHWISRPLKDLAHASIKLAQGNYATRVRVHGPDETRAVANAFNTMAQRVELSQQAQRDFLANVSHDLRTPLTSIQGFAQAIAEGVADADSGKQAAGIIYNEAGRLNRMVNDLLDLARIQAGRMDMMRQAVELDEILQAVSASLMMKATQKKITLNMQVPVLPRIAGDGDRLAQVFTNLIDNALNHTDEHGQIWVRAGLEDRGVLVEIEDTGEGIPKADLPRIFERFYQVDKSRTKRVGTGLGLAITQEIVHAHAGRIWAESDYGKGARFSVWLPQPMHDMRETVVMRRKS